MMSIQEIWYRKMTGRGGLGYRYEPYYMGRGFTKVGDDGITRLYTKNISLYGSNPEEGTDIRDVDEDVLNSIIESNTTKYNNPDRDRIKNELERRKTAHAQDEDEEDEDEDEEDEDEDEETPIDDITIGMVRDQPEEQEEEEPEEQEEVEEPTSMVEYDMTKLDNLVDEINKMIAEHQHFMDEYINDDIVGKDCLKYIGSQTLKQLFETEILPHIIEFKFDDNTTTKSMVEYINESNATFTKDTNNAYQDDHNSIRGSKIIASQIIDNIQKHGY